MSKIPFSWDFDFPVGHYIGTTVRVSHYPVGHYIGTTVRISHYPVGHYSKD